MQALEQDLSPDGLSNRTTLPRPGKPASRAAAADGKRNPLQLTLPDSAIPLEEPFAFSRPAGFTRSGENDEFGRGVIRALRKTMPDLGPTRGRVTVRFVLSERESHRGPPRQKLGKPALDQAVMFAVQQSSFPFPPPNAPLVDRTFLVTYIYETRDRG